MGYTGLRSTYSGRIDVVAGMKAKTRDEDEQFLIEKVIWRRIHARIANTHTHANMNEPYTTVFFYNDATHVHNHNKYTRERMPSIHFNFLKLTTIATIKMNEPYTTINMSYLTKELQIVWNC